MSIPKYHAGKPLHQQLREHAANHAQAHFRQFWPTAIWRALLTKESIGDELQKSGVANPVTRSLPAQILSPDHKAYVLIFTIFVLLERSADIEHVLNCGNGIRDDQLPLVLKNENGIFMLMRGQEPINCCFYQWRHNELEAFLDYYRRLTVPVFGLSEQYHEVNHQEFDQQVILPWCNEENVATVAAMSGGCGTVTRVRIHPLCHRFHDVLESINVADGLFAVKKLKTQTKNTFETEVNALKRFSGKVHKNLVTLLATFEQGGYYHMIFPWASCDLDHYWKDKKPTPDSGDILLIRWLSQQCLGLMEAVSVIHKPTHLQSERRFGRHGDIKAENILWYGSDPHSSNDKGILVISDLGLAAINSDKSKSMQPNTGLKMTPSYRPPECDIKGGKISQAFDIWTLGCLYLELLCWLLGGYEGKAAFDSERMTTFIFGAKTDIFFDIQCKSHTDNQKELYIFMVKKAVSEQINKLHKNEKCTPWMHELLDLVEQHMLVVLSKDRKRKKSDDLLEELRKMDKKCQREEDYCLKKEPRSRVWEAQNGVLAELNEGAKKMVRETNPNLEVYGKDPKGLSKSLIEDEQSKECILL